MMSLQNGDSPFSRYASDLPGDVMKNNYASDTFKTWVLYKPRPIVNGQSVTYVPLQVYEWTWTGETRRNDTTGKYEKRQGTVTRTKSPMDTTDHPQWDTIINVKAAKRT